MVLNWCEFYLPGDVWRYLEAFWVVTPGECYWTSCNTQGSLPTPEQRTISPVLMGPRSRTLFWPGAVLMCVTPVLEGGQPHGELGEGGAGASHSHCQVHTYPPEGSC